MFIYESWYDNIKDYSVLSFIIKEISEIKQRHTESLKELLKKRLYAVVINLQENLNLNLNLKTVLIRDCPGKDYHIYKTIIGNNPQPVPELKNYPEDIARKLSTHPCWIEWAAIYDRNLTDDERSILSKYRQVYIKFLFNNDFERAKGVLNLAKYPYTLNLINFKYLYSKKIITDMLL